MDGRGEGQRRRQTKSGDCGGKQFAVLKLTEARASCTELCPVIHCGIKTRLHETQPLVSGRFNGIISQPQAEHRLSHLAGAPLTRGLKEI